MVYVSDLAELLSELGARRRVPLRAHGKDEPLKLGQQERAPVVRVGIFNATYLVSATIGSFVLGNKEFLFYISVMIILIGAVWWVHFRVSLTSGALWALSVWGLAHMVGGLLPLPDGWPYDGEHHVL